MKLAYQSSSLPFYFEIDGSITQIDYSWKIEPILEKLRDFDHKDESFNDLFYMLYRVKEWCNERGYSFILKAAFLFKAAFYMFCQLIK
jgi:hypothetical protein